MIGCILNLELLLHYYCSKEPFDPNRMHTQAVIDGMKFLLEQGMIDRIDFPSVTEKGQAFVSHLLSVPFPVTQWVIPDGSSDGSS